MKDKLMDICRKICMATKETINGVKEFVDDDNRKIKAGIIVTGIGVSLVVSGVIGKTLK